MDLRLNLNINGEYMKHSQRSQKLPGVNFNFAKRCCNHTYIRIPF